MKTPDITPVQIIVGAVLVLLNVILGGLGTFGIPLTIEQVTYLNGVFAALGALVIACDTVLRMTRAKNADKIAAAKASRRR